MSADTRTSRRVRRLHDEAYGNLTSPVVTPKALVVDSETRLVVLAANPDEVTAVDPASGVFVRARLVSTQPDLEPYDVVVAEVRLEDDIPDPARPEAVRLARPMELIGRFRGYRARRFVDTLVVPPSKDLIGFPGPSTPYWSVPGTNPSVALIRPERGPQVMARAEDSALKARFTWGGVEHQLPVTDARLAQALSNESRVRLAGPQLDKALGFKIRYMLVVLTPPINGHCYKAVAAALPRP